MADVGAVSEGLAILDSDISRAAPGLTACGRELLGVSAGVLSERYGSAAVQGLRAAGERTRALAAQGTLPDVAPLREPISRANAVRFPAHVPAAQAAMIELLGRSGPISPNDLAVLVRAQGRLSEHAARLTHDPALADLARQHAVQLAGVIPRRTRTSGARPRSGSVNTRARSAGPTLSHDSCRRAPALMASPLRAAPTPSPTPRPPSRSPPRARASHLELPSRVRHSPAPPIVRSRQGAPRVTSRSSSADVTISRN